MSFTRGKLYFSDISAAIRDNAISDAVVELKLAGIAGAIITTSIGIWNGEREFGFVIEVLSDNGQSLTIRLETVAEYLRKEYHQTSVLVTVETVEGKLIFVDVEL